MFLERTKDAWFTKTETSKDRDYSIPYPRVENIRSLIFKLHQEEGSLDVQKLGKFFRPELLISSNKKAKTYLDLLVAEV